MTRGVSFLVFFICNSNHSNLFLKKKITRKKLVVVGDGGCGKTSLLVVYQKKEFPKVGKKKG